MRKNVLLGVAGGGLLVVGLFAGALIGGNVSAAANHPTTTTSHTAALTAADAVSVAATSQYCQAYEDSLAKHLNVSNATLEQAAKDAATETVNQAAKDGTITAQQQTQILQRLSQLGAKPCALISQPLGGLHGAGHGPQDAGAMQALQGARTAIETSVAQSLGISAATLDSDLKSGQTIQQITTAQGKKIADVQTAYLSAVQTQLAQAVKGGQITQAQADQVTSVVQQAVTAGHFPGLDERGAGHFGPPQGSTNTGINQ